MYPHERSLVKQLAGKPFALIGVNSDGDIDELKEIIKKKNLTWRSFQNDEGVDGTISDMWGIQGWPTIFLIDAEGVIRWTDHSSAGMDDMITELLGEIGHEVVISHPEEEEEDEDADKSGDSEDEEEDEENEEGDGEQK